MFSSGMMVSRHYTPPCTDCSSTLSACLSSILTVCCVEYLADGVSSPPHTNRVLTALLLCLLVSLLRCGHNSLPLPAAPLQEYYGVGTSSGRLKRLLDGRVQSCVGSVRCVIPRPKSEATSTHNPHNTLPPIASTMDGASQLNTHHGTPRPPCRVGCKMRHEVERTTSFLSTNSTTFGSNKKHSLSIILCFLSAPWSSPDSTVWHTRHASTTAIVF